MRCPNCGWVAGAMACLGPEGVAVSIAPQGGVLTVASVNAAARYNARAGAELHFAIRADGGLNLLYCDGFSDRACISREQTVEILAWLWRNAMARPLTRVELMALKQFDGMKRTAAQALDGHLWMMGDKPCLTLERLGYLRQWGVDPVKDDPIYELTDAGRVALGQPPIDASPEAR